MAETQRHLRLEIIGKSTDPKGFKVRAVGPPDRYASVRIKLFHDGMPIGDANGEQFDDYGITTTITCTVGESVVESMVEGRLRIGTERVIVQRQITWPTPGVTPLAVDQWVTIPTGLNGKYKVYISITSEDRVARQGVRVGVIDLATSKRNLAITDEHGFCEIPVTFFTGGTHPFRIVAEGTQLKIEDVSLEGGDPPITIPEAYSRWGLLGLVSYVICKIIGIEER